VTDAEGEQVAFLWQERSGSGTQLRKTHGSAETNNLKGCPTFADLPAATQSELSMIEGMRSLERDFVPKDMLWRLFACFASTPSPSARREPLRHAAPKNTIQGIDVKSGRMV
jgi:hypothetical protein